MGKESTQGCPWGLNSASLDRSMVTGLGSLCSKFTILISFLSFNFCYLRSFGSHGRSNRCSMSIAAAMIANGLIAVDASLITVARDIMIVPVLRAVPLPSDRKRLAALNIIIHIFCLLSFESGR